MRLFLSALLVTAFQTAYCQSIPEIAPHFAWTGGVNSSTIELPALDLQEVQMQDLRNDTMGGPRRVGVLQPVDIDLDNAGTWDVAPGGFVWSLRIHAPNALAVNPYFDEFHLPEGATFHVYDPSHSDVVGAFTARNNPSTGFYATSYVHGDQMILEYFVPEEHSGEGRIHISDINFMYRDIPQDEKEAQVDRADPCEVDVNCSEGNGWEEQRDAVVRILTRISGGTYWCSGAVMNNTAQDCTPYVLSAHHCQSDGINSSSASDYLQYIIYFNFQRSLCGGGAAPTNQNITGVTMRANSNDNGGASGSDFLLLEINTAIPGAYNAFYAGWDATGTGSTSGVGIHHPAGDEKKISTYTSALVSSSWGSAFGSHWRVQWSATPNGHGVTEGGSSGSPIFNTVGRVLGQLTGGSSFCSNPTQPDYYGKMSYNWSNNPNPASQKLKLWLDPVNGGSSTTFNGNYSPCTIGLDENEVTGPEWDVFPNPAEDEVRVEFGQHVQGGLRLLDPSGRVVMEVEVDSEELNLDLSKVSSGLYYIVLQTTGKTQARQLMVK